jgi:hypothetical protein
MTQAMYLVLAAIVIIVLFTTRPIREGRRAGTVAGVHPLADSGLVIEALRAGTLLGGPVSCPLPRSYCPSEASPPSLTAANFHLR